MDSQKPYALKAICPTKLFNRVNGPHGKNKRAIEQATGTSIHVAHGGERFATDKAQNWKLLTIFGLIPETIVVAIKNIVDATIECAKRETQAATTEAEFCGKEPGECIFRIAVPNRATPSITPRFKEIREKTGAKIVFDRQVIAAHMQLKVLGNAVSILAATSIINECVQSSCYSEDWYSGWAMFADFTRPEGEPDAWYKYWAENAAEDNEAWQNSNGTAPRVGGMRNKAWGAASSPLEEDASAGVPAKHRRLDNADGYTWGSTADWSESRTWWKGSTGSSAQDQSTSEVSQRELMLEALSWAVHKLGEVGEEQLERHFTLTCDLPQNIASEMSGPRERVLQEISEETETTIRFESIAEDKEKRQCLVIQGPLLCTFIAHRCMMRRYHIAAENLISKPSTQAQAPVSVMKGKGLVKGLMKGKGKGKGCSDKGLRSE